VFYCGRTCQVQHWKSGHKRVCRRTAEEHRKAEHDKRHNSDHRPSMIFSLDNEFSGTYNLTFNVNSGLVNTSTPTTKLKSGRHGEEEFIVKLQRPMDSTEQNPGLWMCYDKSRSITTQLDSKQDLHNMRKAFQLMLSKGVTTRGVRGAKAYFFAKREGRNLRIFIEKLAEPQPW